MLAARQEEVDLLYLQKSFDLSLLIWESGTVHVVIITCSYSVLCYK